MERPRNASKVIEPPNGASGICTSVSPTSAAYLLLPYCALGMVVGSRMHRNSEQCECTPRTAQVFTTARRMQGWGSEYSLGRAQGFETCKLKS